MNFKQMSQIIPEQETENFKVVHHLATAEDVRRCKMFDRKGEYSDFKEGTYVELKTKKSLFSNIVMSDTPMELRTNLEAIYNSNGNVLIGGLGIGAILLLIQEKPEVKSIIVIEKYKEIIEMIKPNLSLNEKVTIIQGDIFEWIPEENTKFDTIYFDIWNNICGDNYSEMKELKKRFRKFLNKENENKWIGYWREEDCRRAR